MSNGVSLNTYEIENSINVMIIKIGSRVWSLVRPKTPNMYVTVE